MHRVWNYCVNVCLIFVRYISTRCWRFWGRVTYHCCRAEWRRHATTGSGKTPGSARMNGVPTSYKTMFCIELTRRRWSASDSDREWMDQPGRRALRPAFCWLVSRPSSCPLPPRHATATATAAAAAAAAAATGGDQTTVVPDELGDAARARCTNSLIAWLATAALPNATPRLITSLLHYATNRFAEKEEQ